MTVILLVLLGHLWLKCLYFILCFLEDKTRQLMQFYWCNEYIVTENVQNKSLSANVLEIDFRPWHHLIPTKEG